MTDPDYDANTVFADHRELLFSIVYSMLGTVTDAEDVLQDTWLSWVGRHATGSTEITSPRAYLVRIATNAALARQAAIKRRRETYVGPWLPEPLATDSTPDPPQQLAQAESVSMAMLVVLDTLTPLERAAFVLHEVFGYPHAEIADILGRAPAAVRQLTHRAREHVHARRPRYRTHPRVQRAVTEKFLAAQAGGNIEELLELLAPDVTFWSDGGGKQRAAMRPIHGAAKVARLLARSAYYRLFPDMIIHHRSVNGGPAMVASSGGAPLAIAVLDIDEATGRIHAIYAVTNPDKLGTIGNGTAVSGER